MALRRRLRRGVDELISNVNLTWRARGRIRPDIYGLWMAARDKPVTRTREGKFAATSPQAAVAPADTPQIATLDPGHTHLQLRRVAVV